MKEKTTVYIDVSVKEEVQVRLIRNGQKQSMSNLIEVLLQQWLEEQLKD